MRIVCVTVEDFVENMKKETVFKGRVWVDVVKKRASEGKHLVFFQASCILDMGDEGQSLLQYGEDCGVDFEDSEPEMEGSETAKRRRMFLSAACSSLEVSIMPGTVDF